MTPHHDDGQVVLHHGDCLDVLRAMPDNSADSVVTDPPYGLEFMGKAWDSFRPEHGNWNDAKWSGQGMTVKSGDSTQAGAEEMADRLQALPSLTYKANLKCRSCGRWQRGSSPCTCNTPDYEPRKNERNLAFQQWCEQWAAECLRVLKPGGHMLAFGGTRTWHRLACAVEDAGFEVRDSIAWMYASGFPKSLNVGKDQRFCQCQAVPYSHDGDVRGMRQNVQQTAESRGPSEVADVLPSMQREGAGSGLGNARTQGTSGAQDVHADVRSEEPGMERRGDLQAAEGELHRPALRPLPAGSAGDGEVGRLHHGAPVSDGSVGGSLVDADRMRQSHRPESAEQRAVEPGAVSDERGSQAGRGRPLCARCGKQDLTGFGTSLKPAFEPIVVARKPLAGTVAQNVTTWGTGALNIDGCRVAATDKAKFPVGHNKGLGRDSYSQDDYTRAMVTSEDRNPAGRWPANVVLDDSQAAALDAEVGTLKSGSRKAGDHGLMGYMGADVAPMPEVVGDEGGPSRFFPTFRYQAKAPTRERVKVDGVAHPTVKPLALMSWLVRLVTPPGGVVLEPFAGSGTTVEAAILEGFRCVAIEREADYLPLIVERIRRCQKPEPTHDMKAADALALFDFEEPA